jgi:hypothetical protein
MISCVPWIPAEFETNVVACCAEEGAMWEVPALFRASIYWARRRKCNAWRCASDTDFDTAALAKRVGAKETMQRFIKRL